MAKKLEKWLYPELRHPSITEREALTIVELGKTRDVVEILKPFNITFDIASEPDLYATYRTVPFRRSRCYGSLDPKYGRYVWNLFRDEYSRYVTSPAWFEPTVYTYIWNRSY